MSDASVRSLEKALKVAEKEYGKLLKRSEKLANTVEKKNKKGLDQISAIIDAFAPFVEDNPKLAKIVKKLQALAKLFD